MSTCPVCKKEVQVTRFRKIAPHKDGSVRCGGSGKRVKEKNDAKNENMR